MRQTKGRLALLGIYFLSALPCIAADCDTGKAVYDANPSLESAKDYIACLEKPVQLTGMIPVATLKDCAIAQPLKPIIIGSPVPNNAQGYVVEAMEALARFKTDNHISDSLWMEMTSSSLSVKNSAIVLMNKDVVDPNLKSLKSFQIDGDLTGAMNKNPQIWLDNNKFKDLVSDLKDSK